MKLSEKPVNNSLPLVPYTNPNSPVKYSNSINKRNLEIQIHNIMNRSLKAQVYDYKYFYQYAMGDIVVLLGTSTAGKTSIIKAL